MDVTKKQELAAELEKVKALFGPPTPYRSGLMPSGREIVGPLKMNRLARLLILVAESVLEGPDDEEGLRQG
jgi:hypothetical protein